MRLASRLGWAVKVKDCRSRREATDSQRLMGSNVLSLIVTCAVARNSSLLLGFKPIGGLVLYSSLHLRQKGSHASMVIQLNVNELQPLCVGHVSIKYIQIRGFYNRLIRNNSLVLIVRWSLRFRFLLLLKLLLRRRSLGHDLRVNNLVDVLIDFVLCVFVVGGLLGQVVGKKRQNPHFKHSVVLLSKPERPLREVAILFASTKLFIQHFWAHERQSGLFNGFDAPHEHIELGQVKHV